jgi:hypothetical protein
MVKINTFLNTTAIQASGSNPVVSPEVISQAERAKFSELGATLNNELARADKLSSEKRRAEFNLAESKFQNKLKLNQTIAAVVGGLGATYNALYEMNDKQRELDTKAQDDVYLSTRSIKAQGDYQNYVRQNPGADANTSAEYMREVSADIITNAPSEAAKIEAVKLTGAMRMDALENSFMREAETRKFQAKNDMDGAIGSLVDQAFNDPNNMPMYLDQLSSLTTGAEYVYGDPNAAQGAIQQAASSVYAGGLKGFSKYGQAELALDLATSESGASTLNNQDFLAVTTTTVAALENTKKQKIETLNQIDNVKTLQAGILPTSKAEATKLSNSLFKAELQQFVQPNGLPVEGLSITDVMQASVSIYSKYPSLPIGSDHKNILETSVTYGSPEVAAENARVIVALANNPNTAPKLAAVSNDTVAEAININKLQEFGFSPKEAVELTRKGRVIDPNKIDVAKQKADAIIKDGALDEYIMDDILDTNVNVDMAISEGRNLYKTLVTKYGDPNIAKEMLKPHLLNKFQVSEFNGSKEVMEAAPEAFYAPHDVKTMKYEFGNYLNNISMALGATGVRENYGNINSISIKNELGQDVQIGVKLQSIPNITKGGSESSRKYMLMDRTTNLPLLKSDLKAGEVDEPVIFDFKLTETESYKKRIQEFNDRKESLRKTRDAENAKAELLGNKILGAAKQRGLDESQVLEMENLIASMRW